MASIVLQRFPTCQGSAQLHVGGSREDFADHYAGFRGEAVVADTVDEFVSLAACSISVRGGVRGDVLCRVGNPPPHMSSTQLRATACVTDSR